MPKLSIIIPCYWNEGNIPATGPALLDSERLFPPGTEFEYVFVDDGSGDGTLAALRAFQAAVPERVRVVKLTRNFGANNASLAGLNHATGDCFAIIAADLQDPPELLPKMFKHWLGGMKLVLANRESREEPFLQRLTSNFFHGLMRKFALPSTPAGGFDLVLFDRCIRDEVVAMNERNAYLPYLFLWLGHEYVSIPYVRRKREIGTSRWTFRKKLKASIDSLVAFSYVPIRAITAIGLGLGTVSLIYVANIVRHKLRGDIGVEGWSSLMVVLLLVSSFQMVAIGVIGEYLWRALDAARGRPNFIIDRVFDSQRRREALKGA